MARFGRSYPVTRVAQIPKRRRVSYGTSVGTGIATPTFAGTVTWTHVGAAGDTVVAFAAVDRQSDLSLTYDGVPMSRRGGMNLASGYNQAGGTSANPLRVFTIPITASNAGLKTVSLSNPGGGYVSGESVSYINVSGIGVPRFTRGLGTSMSHADTPSGGGMLAQAFAAIWLNSGAALNFSALSGGVNRFSYGTAANTAMTFSDSTGPTTFVGTINSASQWGSLSLPLSANPSGGPQYDTYGGYGYALWNSGALSVTGALHGAVVSAGANVFVDITFDRGATIPGGVTYDGNAMTLVDSQTHTSWTSGNAITYRYRITGVTAGAKTIAFTPSGVSMYYTVSVTSFTNVTGVSTTKTSGTASNPSHSATLAANQIALQSFGISGPPASGWFSTGNGALLWDSAGASAYGNTVTRYSDVVGSNTFGITDATNNWGSITTVIS